MSSSGKKAKTLSLHQEKKLKRYLFIRKKAKMVSLHQEKTKTLMSSSGKKAKTLSLHQEKAKMVYLQKGFPTSIYKLPTTVILICPCLWIFLVIELVSGVVPWSLPCSKIKHYKILLAPLFRLLFTFHSLLNSKCFLFCKECWLKHFIFPIHLLTNISIKIIKCVLATYIFYLSESRSILKHLES